MEHVLHIGRREAYTELWWVNLRERDNLGDLGVGGRIILRRMLIKVQHDATVCRHLFSVTLLYMFRVSCTHHQEY